MARRSPARALRVVPKTDDEVSFDASLHRALNTERARELARELGRQAAREWFDEMRRKQREAS